MNCFFNTHLIPLPSDCYCRYLCGAFDGENYHFCIGTDCDGRVDKYNSKLTLIRSAKTCRAYCALTYDPVMCCFWAVACNMPGRLFKLDMCFREIDSITISRTDTYCISCGSISGVSYNCGNDTLVVSFYDAVWEVNKNGDLLNRISGYRQDFVYSDVLSVFPYTILTLINANAQIILVLDGNNVRVDEDIIPNDFQPEAIIFNPCINETGEFFALVTRHREYSRLLRLQFFPALVPNECNFNICNNPCKCKALDVPGDEISPESTAEQADTGSTDTSAQPVPENKGAAAKCDALLGAMAGIETALTGILNAESDKLRRAIDKGASAAELATENKSVESILTNAASLEDTLCEAISSIKKLSLEEPGS